MANNASNNGFNIHLKNTARLHWNSKPTIEPEIKDLEFQTAEIVIPNEEKADSTLDRFIEAASESKIILEKPNRLIWGDNLLIMQSLLSEGYEGKIDLIYTDPPFNTGEEFNFVTETSIPSGEKLEKEWTMIERLAYTDTWERGMDSYLDMLYVRFKLMRRLLSPEGCIYVHLDPNMGHRVKLLLDEVFGYENFKAEITWKKTTKTTSFKNYGSEHDVIYYYVKSNESMNRIPLIKSSDH
jgi:adenine-specific DNA-methyltransferase